MEFRHQQLEGKWKVYWEEHAINAVSLDRTKEKYYILDMFPYPSGAGLHVGHPLGYITSDIISRYKKMQGFNVLHPMGFDAFGLPAEQYAIQTGVHPADSTKENIERYRSQLRNIGFNYDWSKEVQTCDPKYYKWTQWIFLKLFDHYYNEQLQKAQSIHLLIQHFQQHGSAFSNASCSEHAPFTAQEWNGMSAIEQEDVLMNYRLAFRKVAYVNWCEALGTVLANDEVKDGVSERGGHPIEKKPMLQWALRITAYAERLLHDLDNLDWSDAMKTMQRNWIGKSSGAQLFFNVQDSDVSIEIFTTRPDTIFGATFLVIAPEHPMAKDISTFDHAVEVEQYLSQIKNRTDLERQSESKVVSGVFTGSYALNPYTKNLIPIYIADYVLIEYGTGAIMAVPGHDLRDKAFAEKFKLPIIQVVNQVEFPQTSIEDKVGTLINSDFLNGLSVGEALDTILQDIEQKKIGSIKVKYKMRDANFSRQRYWGEPFPISYDTSGVPHKETHLPLQLPLLDDFQATAEGKSPLARATDWLISKEGYIRETDTMPGYAGSSWYFLRYMDPHNDEAFASAEALNYWKDVDFYIGGTEHAVGHLMYARFWHKFLFDLGLVPTIEPFKKLVNQGMIQGIIESLYLIKDQALTFISANLISNYKEEELAKIPVHVDFVTNYGSPESHLNAEGVDKFVAWRPEYKSARFITKTGTFTAGIDIPQDFKFDTHSEVGKMSKRYYNVVNPDDVVAEYGADCFRMYEMFLGPIEQAKPWDIKGIDGVSKFLRKYWDMFFENGTFQLTEQEASAEELRILHQAIKKITDDIERLSINTCVSSFMICVNELRKINCNTKSILLELNALMAPFAPFITEEIYALSGGSKASVHLTRFPTFNPSYLETDEVNYPVSVNGKKRYEWLVPKSMSKGELETLVLTLPEISKWTDGQTIKKIIIVPGRMINIVL